MRFFYHENASQPVIAGGKTIQFEVVTQVSGKLIGVHAADGAEADALGEVVKRRVGVTEIPQADYDLLQSKKKATPISYSLNSLRTSSRPVVQPGSVPQPPLAERQVVVSAGGNLPKPEPKAEFPAVDEVLKVEPVAPPKPIVEGDRRVGESKRRSKSKAE
jgi:hypothetical protein